MKIVAVAFLFLVSLSAHADWEMKSVTNTSTEPQTMAPIISLANGIRGWLTSLNLVSKSKIVITKIEYTNRIYRWDGKCDLHVKGEIMQRESSVAEGYFDDKPDEPWMFWHHESNAVDRCPGYVVREQDLKPRNGMRRLH
jgi:hypothetical protein